MVVFPPMYKYCFIVLACTLLISCNRTTEPKQNLKTEFEYKQTVPQGEITDEKKGKQVWFAYGALRGVQDVPASGVAQSFVFENGSTQHGLQVNVGLPGDDRFYEGWLFNPDTEDMISTGHLRSLLGDERHVLQFTTEEDLQKYTSVIITIESDDGNPAPGKRVVEGILKTVQR